LCKIHCLHFLFRAQLAVSFVMDKEFTQDIKPNFNFQTTFAVTNFCILPWSVGTTTLLI